MTEQPDQPEQDDESTAAAEGSAFDASVKTEEND